MSALSPKPDDSPLAWALYYASLGWAVFPLHTALPDGECSCGFPCGNAGKHPRTPHGFRDATTDPSKITKLWIKWPDANVGIATGLSNLLVADIDVKKNGDKTWSAMCLEHGLPPNTILVDTGGGGFHAYYRKPSGVFPSKGNTHGVDVRCDGGYVVAPPSVHASGKRYLFREGASPADCQPADPPDYVIALLYPPKPAPPAVLATGDGWLISAFRAAGLVQRELDDGKVSVTCPWASEHTTGSNNASTVVFPPSAGHTLGHYHCSHSHCANRTLGDIREALGPTAIREANRLYPPIRDTAPRLVPLQSKQDGTPYATLDNILLILAHDTAWDGVFQFDAFRGQVQIIKQPPWDLECQSGIGTGEVSDVDASRLTAWLARRYRLRVGVDLADKAIETHARTRQVHPVREYLIRCRDNWDAKQRLTTMASTYLGADPIPHYQTAMLRHMIGSVRRIMAPGCKHDTMLVFEGGQGIGKSRFIEVMYRPWSADEIGDITSKDAADALRGTWCVEMAELKGWRRQDEEARKAFLSRSVDHYRPAYGRRTVDVPRQNVFIATTNDNTWQTDATGARRYWVVRCGRIDLDALARDRDQLWGEAAVRHEAHEQTWLTPAEEIEQRTAVALSREIDPWEETVLSLIDACNGYTTIRDMLVTGLEIDESRVTVSDSRRVGRILRANGWTSWETHNHRIYWRK